LRRIRFNGRVAPGHDGGGDADARWMVEHLDGDDTWMVGAPTK